MNKLYENLSEAFQEKLKPKELYYFSDGVNVDVFKTLLSLKKTKKDFNQIMLEGSVSFDELKYNFDNTILSDSFDNKYIIRGNSIKSDKIFIGANGLFKLYSLRDYDVNEVFIAYDSCNFKLEKQFSLKSQEKIWCIFLLLFGADSKDNLFSSEGLTPSKLKDYHRLLILIETEMENKGITLGVKVGWESGKDKVFRKFITNNVDLPKTGLYFKGNKWEYYLDLAKRKNARYLLDLILNNHIGENRLLANDLFYDALNELSFKLSVDFGEIPSKINSNIIEELKS